MKDYSQLELNIIEHNYRLTSNYLNINWEKENYTSVRKQMERIAEFLNEVVIELLKDNVEGYENTTQHFVEYDGSIYQANSYAIIDDPYLIWCQINWFMRQLKNKMAVTKEENLIVTDIQRMFMRISDCDEKRTEDYYNEF